MIIRVEIKPGIKYTVLNDPDTAITDEGAFLKRMATEAEAEEGMI